MLKFTKYESNGNHFVIVDESNENVIPEAEKSHFSVKIADPQTGIGCDSILFLQRYGHHFAKNIQNPRVSVKNIFSSGQPSPQFVMRVFEPDGSESFCCGNGLVSVAQYLKDQLHIQNAYILTEVGSKKPVVRHVELSKRKTIKIEMGVPRRPCKSIIRGKSFKEYDFYVAANLKLPEAVRNIFKKRPKCYITYTGEPHLVFFDVGLAESDALIRSITLSDETKLTISSTEILHKIGLYLNTHEMFPQGVNVSFASELGEGHIAYRCFERGVNRETFACGTGATAVAALYGELFKRLSTYNITTYRMMKGNKSIVITANVNNHFYLESMAQKVFRGEIERY